MPPRHGQLFSPHEHPFLEGWRGEPGSAPVVDPTARAETRLPSIDDETVFRVLAIPFSGTGASRYLISAASVTKLSVTRFAVAWARAR